MAIYSTGISATWGSVTFGEMQSLSWSYGGTSTGRGEFYADEVGTVSIQCLNAVGISPTTAGDRDQLVITGGGCGLTVDAVWDSVSVDAQLNGVTKYSVTLKIIK